MPNTAGVVDLASYRSELENDGNIHLTPEDEEQLATLAKEHPEDAPETRQTVTTAFTVFVTTDGEVLVSPELDLPLTPQRVPTLSDIYGACAVVMKDLQGMETAQRSHQLQMQFAQAVAQQQRNQQIMAQLPKNLRGKG